MPNHNKSAIRGMVAGAIGGLVASWVMNVFMAEAGDAVTHAAEHLDGTAHKPKPAPPRDNDEPRIDATMKTADAIVSRLTAAAT